MVEILGFYSVRNFWQKVIEYMFSLIYLFGFSPEICFTVSFETYPLFSSEMFASKSRYSEHFTSQTFRILDSSQATYGFRIPTSGFSTGVCSCRFLAWRIHYRSLWGSVWEQPELCASHWWCRTAVLPREKKRVSISLSNITRAKDLKVSHVFWLNCLRQFVLW